MVCCVSFQAMPHAASRIGKFEWLQTILSWKLYYYSLIGLIVANHVPEVAAEFLHLIMENNATALTIYSSWNVITSRHGHCCVLLLLLFIEKKNNITALTPHNHKIARKTKQQIVIA